MTPNSENPFPAKLLLFGEYSVLLGSSALGMPFGHFGATLGFIRSETGDLLSNATESNSQLKGMCDYFTENSPVFEKFLDLARLRSDISNGLYLASTIPRRYGLGSSGALCAAIYDRYHVKIIDPSQQTGLKGLASLRDIFARMESFFHGRSSGFDPLVSSVNTPLFLTAEGRVDPVVFPEWLISGKLAGILLIDSGRPCSTGPLVANFLAEYAPGGTVTSKGAELCSLADAAIGNFLDPTEGDLWENLKRLSRFQLTELDHLVPASVIPLWTEGLQSGLFTLKLCGSGGGGFLLCFTKEKNLAEAFFKDRNIPAIPVRFS